MNKICGICYREFPEDQIRGDMCFKCKDIIGKGDGYKSLVSEEDAEKWLEGCEERKKKVEKES